MVTMPIDMHAHYVPPAVLRLIQEDAVPDGIRLKTEPSGEQCIHFDYGIQIRPFFPQILDLEERWEVMSEQGIDRQVLSVWADLFGYGLPAAEGTKWHRLLNEHLFETTQRYPERLSALASVPLQDAGSAAKELEYGVRECGAVGGVIGANVVGMNLGDVPLDEFWAKAVELDVPLFIHPTEPTPPARVQKYGLNQVVQYTFDTTVTVGSIIFSGVLDRFRGLKLILSHGGGYFPYQVGRFDRIYRRLEESSETDRPSEPPSAYLTRFYYDTIIHHPTALQFLVEIVGSSQVLLGSDYPFPPRDPNPLKLLQDAALSSDDVDRIADGNATRLFDLRTASS